MQDLEGPWPAVQRIRCLPAPCCPTLRTYSAVTKPAWKKYAQRPIPVKFVK